MPINIAYMVIPFKISHGIVLPSDILEGSVHTALDNPHDPEVPCIILVDIG